MPQDLQKDQYIQIITMVKLYIFRTTFFVAVAYSMGEWDSAWGKKCFMQKAQTDSQKWVWASLTPVNVGKIPLALKNSKVSSGEEKQK